MALSVFSSDIEKIEKNDMIANLTPSASQQNLVNLRWDSPVEVLHLKENETIYAEGDMPKGLYLIRSGAVKVSVNRPFTRGRMNSPEYITKVVGAGDLFGYKAIIRGTAQTEHAKALKATEIFVYSKEAVQSIMTGQNSMGKMLLNQMLKDMEGKEMNNQLHYLASVQERIAYQLVLLADKFGVQTNEGVHINLKLTRNELAQLAGTINESLSRHLTELKMDGVLELVGKEIIVKNRPALMQKSGNFR